MRLKLLLTTILLTTLWTVRTTGVVGDPQVQLAGALCPSCVNRIRTVISKAWTLSDPLSASYSVLTHSILGVEVPDTNDVCKFLQTSLDNLDGSKIEPIFVISSAISKLQGCKAPGLKAPVKQALEKTLKEGTSTQDIYYAIQSSKLIPGIQLDISKLNELIKSAIKSDDTPASIGYGLWATSLIYKPGQKLEIWDRIEDVIAQADEVDKQYLQFEGGLSVTAAVVNGVFRVAEVAGKSLPLSNEQVVKFGNYVVSRKTVTTPRGAWLFSSTVEVLSSNKFAVPVYIGLTGSNVLTESNQVVTVKAVDLMGRPVPVTLMLESLTEKFSGKPTDVQFIQGVQDGVDKGVFKWDLKSKGVGKGFYVGVVSAKASSGKGGGEKLVLVKSSVELKVVGKLGALTARLGVADSDQQSKTSWVDLNRGQKLDKKLELEPAQKLIVKVGASDKLHQVFVLFKNKGSGREVAFIGQGEGDGVGDYKLELDLTQNAKELGYRSGVYEITLVLGDFLIEDPIEWSLGEVNLQVAQGKTKTVNPLYAITYGVKPEIKHEFRKPEPRPARVLSDAFTILVLVPLLALLVMWIRIGANINNFSSVFLSGLGFHVGLAGIFGVYAIFWLGLTMFEALKWMAVPGVVTFISGHRMLSQISQKKKV